MWKKRGQLYYLRDLPLTSQSPGSSWFFSWSSQSSSTLSQQWCMVRMMGRVSRAPGGPQLTTGLSTVWMSSTGGLGTEGGTADSVRTSVGIKTGRWCWTQVGRNIKKICQRSFRTCSATYNPNPNPNFLIQP